MSEKLECLKLKRHGQRGTVMKNRQEATSLLESEKLEPSAIWRLGMPWYYSIPGRKTNHFKGFRRRNHQHMST